jgi:hypothetical protein
LKHSTIQRFEKDIQDASTTNNIRNITKRLTKQQTQRHALVIHGRRGLTDTPLGKATSVAEVHENQFRSNPEEHNLDNFYRQIKREVAACLQLESVNPTTPRTQNRTLRILKHLPKRKAAGHDNIVNIDLRNLPLNPVTHLMKIINSAFCFHYFPQTWKEADVISVTRPSKNPALP